MDHHECDPGHEVDPMTLPAVFAAATVITHGKRILMLRNSEWGSFTLPMTKQRRWIDREQKIQRDEPWLNAAIRAATECLGVLFCSEQERLSQKSEFLLPDPKLLVKEVEVRQGDRTGELKLYHFQVYGLALEHEPGLVPGLITQWLTAEQILDEHIRPISGTARFVIGELDRIARKQNKTFPDSTIEW